MSQTFDKHNGLWLFYDLVTYSIIGYNTRSKDEKERGATGITVFELLSYWIDGSSSTIYFQATYMYI